MGEVFWLLQEHHRGMTTFGRQGHPSNILFVQMLGHQTKIRCFLRLFVKEYRLGIFVVFNLYVQYESFHSDCKTFLV